MTQKMYKELDEMVKIKFPPFHFSYLCEYLMRSSGLSSITIRNGWLINVETLYILIEMFIRIQKQPKAKQTKSIDLIKMHFIKTIVNV